MQDRPDALFINVSNHPSAKWGQGQLDAARWDWFGPHVGGEQVERTIVDLSFPQVDPAWDVHALDACAQGVVSTLKPLFPMGWDMTRAEDEEWDAPFWRCANKMVFHVMGEMGLTLAVLQRLHRMEKRLSPFITVHSTTKRYLDGGFYFVKFRQYTR